MKIKVVQEYFNLSYGKLSQKIFSHVSFFMLFSIDSI